jgi:hypothetical protein
VFGVAAGVAAFLGHLLPVYLRFRGGKGVATGAGVVAVLTPVPAVAALLAWAALFAAIRYVSVASLAAAALLCVLHLALTPHPWAWPGRVVTLFCLVGAGVVLLRHRANLSRLYHGTENRFKDTPAMLLLAKTLHVLALGLWFGAVAYFTFGVGLQVFGAFEDLALKPGPERPYWFQLPAGLDRPPPSDRFPDPLRKEQGSRAAGVAVGAMFRGYYGLQVVCGVLAVFTALAWAWGGAAGWGHWLRAVVLLLALVLAGVGWWVEGVVEGLRVSRNERSDAVLLTPSPDPQALQSQIRQAEEARAAFARWHGVSLVLNLAVLALVAVGMALAAQLPGASAAAPGVNGDAQATASNELPASAGAHGAPSG